MDVAGWLRGLGLEQYAHSFRDNDGLPCSVTISGVMLIGLLAGGGETTGKPLD